MRATVRPYRASDADVFKALNVAWIAKHFVVEASDLKSLDHPEKVLESGGAIFMAEYDGECVGTSALIPYDADTLELAKMTVAEHCRGLGIGAALMETSIDLARALGARRLYLESNSKLTPALTLYEKYGFVHLPPERRPSSPYARADIFMELLLSK
ncbi:MAG TPA: GNAT family N-acetyltransferase [Caulobacterales bacterium]|nr:GNAT family N-acetyltransferase [Caulobacterales bacterium]